MKNLIDLVMHCLAMSHKKDARLKLTNKEDKNVRKDITKKKIRKSASSLILNEIITNAKYKFSSQVVN